MHTLIAELKAQKDGRVLVVNDNALQYFSNLRDAETYAFGLGADTITSVQGQPGILRATRRTTGKRTYHVAYEGIDYTRSTHRDYSHAVVCWRSEHRSAGELKCSSSEQGAYKAMRQWQQWFGQGCTSPVLVLTQQSKL